jgi:hypothetical protein
LEAVTRVSERVIAAALAFATTQKLIEQAERPRDKIRHE